MNIAKKYEQVRETCQALGGIVDRRGQYLRAEFPHEVPAYRAMARIMRASLAKRVKRRFRILEIYL